MITHRTIDEILETLLDGWIEWQNGHWDYSGLDPQQKAHAKIQALVDEAYEQGFAKGVIGELNDNSR